MKDHARKPASQYTSVDIARLAGVSQATVSKVLHNTKGNIGVSEATRQRVVDIARQVGYRRNLAAVAARSGRFGCVALILSAAATGRSTLPDKLLGSICKDLEASSLHLIVASLPDAALTDDAYVPKILRDWSSDGLLINYNKLVPPRMAELIEQYAIPSVWLNCKREFDCVHPDDLGAGRAATAELIARGHRQIDYVSMSHDQTSVHYSEQDRMAGYEQAMREAGLTARVYTQYNMPGGVAHREVMSHRLLTRDDAPSAIVTYGSSTTLPILFIARALGGPVWDKLALVTFHEDPVWLGGKISTWIVPSDAVGEQGVAMLLERIANPKSHLPTRAVPYTEVVHAGPQ